MTLPVGGLRDRLIHDSLFYMVKNGLNSIGWFNTNRTFAYPVNLIAEQVSWEDEVPLNSITVAPGMVSDEEAEIGVNAMRNTWEFYIDVYGENEALGLQLSGDIRDLLRGKFPSHGYSQPSLNVYDYTQASPPWLFFCDIENVTRMRAQNFSHHWQRYLYSVKLEVVDFYRDDGDTFAYGFEVADTSYGDMGNSTFGGL